MPERLCSGRPYRHGRCQTAGRHKPGRRTLLFRPARRKRWWRWVIASTTDKWAGPRARAAMAPSGKGTPLGPDLTDQKWLWSDGSYTGIAKTITDGVPQPKEYRSPMPPMGGAQLTADQVKALAAYVWSMSHH